MPWHELFIRVPVAKKVLHQIQKFFRYLLSLKNWVGWIRTKRKKNSNLKNVHFEKNCPNVQIHIIFLFHDSFNNFSLKVETTWAGSVVKPISETRNSNDVIMFAWFIHSPILKRYNVKKNRSKCTKFTATTKIRQIKTETRFTM